MEKLAFFTERAHLMCPRMGFSLLGTLDAPLDGARLQAVLAQLTQAHPLLRARLGHEARGNCFYYDLQPEGQTELRIVPAPEKAEDALALHETHTARDWNLTAEGMLKILCWPQGQRTGVLFTFHHLLADGRGALGLLREFAEGYVQGLPPQSVPEKLIGQEDFPAGSELPWISRRIMESANRRWAGEEHEPLSYGEYHAWAQCFLEKDAVTHRLEDLSAEETEALRRQCRAEGITVNDYWLGRMLAEEGAREVVMAADLRAEVPCYRPGSLGNFATAFTVRVNGAGSDALAAAKKAHSAVKKARKNPAARYTVLQCYAMLNPALLDAAAMAGLGAYPSRAAAFVGGQLFGFARRAGHSVTNLGTLDCAGLGRTYFIPPASPAMQKTWGIVTVNGEMTRVCCERA